jgi:hypothetical protein
MSTGSIRNLIIARAVSVEPLTRALCRDPLDGTARPFARPDDRWHRTAARAGLGGGAADEPDVTSTNQEKP